MGGDGPETPRLYPLQHGCTKGCGGKKWWEGQQRCRLHDLLTKIQGYHPIPRLSAVNSPTFWSWELDLHNVETWNGHAKEPSWYLAAFELNGVLAMVTCFGCPTWSSSRSLSFRFTSVFFYRSWAFSLMDGYTVAHIQINGINALRTTLLAKISSAGTPRVDNLTIWELSPSIQRSCCSWPLPVNSPHAVKQRHSSWGCLETQSFSVLCPQAPPWDEFKLQYFSTFTNSLLESMFLPANFLGLFELW